MVKCPKCGKEIRYIPTRDSVIIVDAEYITIVNDRGREIEGHIMHECKDETNESLL